MNILLHRFNNFNNFVTLSGTRLRRPEDDADALKHAGVLTILKYYTHTHTYMGVCVFCAFVGLDNKLYKMHSCTVKKKKVFPLRPGVAQRVARGIALLFHDRGTRRG